MLYFKMIDGKAVSAQSEYPRETNGGFDKSYVNRNDFKSLADAEKIASDLNSMPSFPMYVATDAGQYVSPQFDIVRAPQRGDEVSYGFNGDCYPDGKIIRTSSSGRVVYTDTGSTYYRRKQTGSWVKKGGTWSLVRGHVNERNPSL